MKSPRRPVLALVAAAVASVCLTGCVRFQAELTVDADDTVDGEVIIAVIIGESSDDDARAEASGNAERIERELLPGLRGAVGVTREHYDEDGYLGSRFLLRDVPLEAFSAGGESSLVLERDGDEFVFTGALDFSPGDDSPPPDDADTSNISVRLTFPGEVVASNGEQSGRTVSWQTSYEEGIELDARASAIPAAPSWPWIAGGATAAALVILLVVVTVMRRRSSVETAHPDGQTPPADAQ